jgi:DNA end-binding protein Ku
MPRASWRGFLRLSLVSCPIYLSPATSRTRPIRLHQVWRPAPAEEADDAPLRVKGQDLLDKSTPRFSEEYSYEEVDQTPGATRITLRPHDPTTGEEIEREDVVKGYEYQRGQFVTFTAEELKALDVESSKVIDLEKFVPRGDIDPVYFDSPYYLYPDGPIVAGDAPGDRGGNGRGRSRRAWAAHAQPARADGDGRAARHRNGAAHITRRKRGSGIAVRQR